VEITVGYDGTALASGNSTSGGGSSNVDAPPTVDELVVLRPTVVVPQKIEVLLV
jgi:hypothetical protein